MSLGREFVYRKVKPAKLVLKSLITRPGWMGIFILLIKWVKDSDLSRNNDDLWQS